MNEILQDTSIDEAKRNDLQSILNHADNHFIDKKTGDELWHWDWVKWYEEYAGIRLLNTIIEPVAYDDYMFIRIGEDYDDSELHGTHENNFSVSLEGNILYSSVE